MSDTGSLLLSMLAVQSEAPTLMKDSKATVRSDKGSYTYTYIGLDTVVEKVGPLLHKNQLVWTTKPSYIEGVGPSLKYKLAHAATKEFEEGEMLLLLPKNDPQGQGSAITYARRYALCAVLNLVADDDDDGARATRQQAKPKAAPVDPPAIAKVKRLLREQKATTAGIRTMLRGAGVQVTETENPIPLVDSLSPAQASAVIEFLTAKSDVPGAAPGEFQHPPAQPTLEEARSTA
jgi:hypothetical protein